MPENHLEILFQIVVDYIKLKINADEFEKLFLGKWPLILDSYDGMEKQKFEFITSLMGDVDSYLNSSLVQEMGYSKNDIDSNELYQIIYSKYGNYISNKKLYKSIQDTPNNKK
jgi:hypothetical protein